MLIRLRRAPSVLSSSLTLLLLALVAIPSRAAEKTHLRVDDYQIEVELTPHLHQISARAKVKFTALQDISVAVFELHNNLRVTRVLDDQNQPLSAERVTQDSTIRVPLPAGLARDASTTLTFEYEGQLETADEQEHQADHADEHRERCDRHRGRHRGSAQLEQILAAGQHLLIGHPQQVRGELVALAVPEYVGALLMLGVWSSGLFFPLGFMPDEDGENEL